MATPSGSGEGRNTIDPKSPNFDPMKALYSPTENFPVPKAKQYNNLAEFENVLKGKDAKTFKQKSERKKQTAKRSIFEQRADAKQHELERKEAILKKNAGPAKRQTVRRTPNVLKRMSLFQKGPLSLLRRCVEERLRVVIVVRAAVAVRSHCRGYVVAFDKHLNMALMDVDEKFIRPRVVDKLLKKTDPEPESGGGLSTETEQLNLKSDSEPETSDHKQSVSSKQVHKTSREMKYSEQVTDLRAKLKSKSHGKQFDDRGGTMSDSSEVKVKTEFSVNRKIKSDSDSVSEQSDVEVTEGRKKSSSQATRIRYKPFWPLYMKWAENRCHASYEVVIRHINQLFIRGDNIVSVSIAQ